MKKYALLLFVAILALGCGRSPKEKAVLARINNYEITRQEFEQEFKDSSFGRADTLESRNEFLNILINRKLILQDAQKKGLDRDKSFLKMIERFWEQSLLKLALDRKSKEIAGSVSVDDKAVEEGYQKMLGEGKIDKAYDQAYSQVKWELTRDKESAIMSGWVLGLRKNAEIAVNSDLLKEDK